MADEKVKWHSAFAAAVQLELKEYRKYLEFITEYQFTDDPLRIDVLVVKKLREIEIDKSLGRRASTDLCKSNSGTCSYIVTSDLFVGLCIQFPL
ncbi:hypothetical protein ACYUJ6_05525 [Clostridium sp. JNZ X4-2]